MLTNLTLFVQQSIFLGDAQNLLNCHRDGSSKSSKYDLEFIFFAGSFCIFKEEVRKLEWSLFLRGFFYYYFLQTCGWLRGKTLGCVCDNLHARIIYVATYALIATYALACALGSDMLPRSGFSGLKFLILTNKIYISNYTNRCFVKLFLSYANPSFLSRNSHPRQT